MSAHWAPFLTSQDRAKGPQCILACNLPWFHCLAWGLGCALIPVWTLVVLTRDRCITQRTSVGEEGLSLQYSTYFVSLYRSRDILFLAVVARCLFWPSLLTIFQQLPHFIMSELNAIGNHSSGTVCIFLLLLNFFTQGKWKGMKGIESHTMISSEECFVYVFWRFLFFLWHFICMLINYCSTGYEGYSESVQLCFLTGVT